MIRPTSDGVTSGEFPTNVLIRGLLSQEKLWRKRVLLQGHIERRPKQTVFAVLVIAAIDHSELENVSQIQNAQRGAGTE